MKKKIATIIIPTYNEADTISKILIYLFEKTFKGISNWEMKVLIVDGNSNDGTIDIVSALTKKYINLDFIKEKEKEGIGSAYIKGFKYAIKKYKTDVLIEFDGDFQHPPETIPIMLNEIDKGYEYVIGSRRIKGGSFPKGWGFKRNFFSRVGGFVARFLLFFPFKEIFYITDPTTGLKATLVNSVFLKFDSDNLFTKSFGYKIEFLFHMVINGAKIKEIPLDFKIREAGKSKITNQTPIEIFRTIFYLRFHDKKTLRFIKFCFVGLIGFFINSIFLEVFYKMKFLDYVTNFFYILKELPIINILSTKSSWAAGMAAELAIINNFLFNNLWTFSGNKIKGISKIIKKLLLFNLTSMGAILIQFIFIGIFSILINESLFIRQITLVFTIILVVVPYNWLLYNKIIWRKNNI